jgi:hypothetical protein
VKVTVETIRPDVDLPKIRGILSALADCGDYERRLIAAGLARLNKDARQLPTCAIVEFLGERSATTK